MVVQCVYCKQTFIHIKKHIWRCSKRLEGEATNENLLHSQHSPCTQHNIREGPKESISIPLNERVDQGNNNTDISNDSNKSLSEHPFQCYCGRYFKSLRSLNLHRISCFI